MGSRLSATAIEGVIRRHRPRGWKLEFDKHPLYRGEVVYGFAEFPMPSAPTKRIVCLPIHAGLPERVIRFRLQIFLHEVGHVRFKHSDTRKVASHIQEYEAEHYAIAAMRHEGIPVPRAGLIRAKRNVRWSVNADRLNGRRIDPKIERWSQT